MSDIAVILVGGRGTRLKQKTKKTPKPLLEINGRSFLDILLSFIFKSQIKKVYLICSYLSKQFYIKYNNKNILGKKIIIITEEKKGGTGGALFYLKKKIKQNFLLFNGDSIVNININEFIKDAKKNSKNLIHMALVRNKFYKSNKKISSININKNNIVYFSKKAVWMNGGIYYINNKVLDLIQRKVFSFEEKILLPLIDNKKISGSKISKSFIDIGTPSSFKNTSKFIKKHFKENVILLDRDGVINKDYGYVFKKKDFHLLSGVIQAIKYANSKGFHVICVTNQAGVGRGFYKEEDVYKLHKYLNNILFKNNCIIEKFYFCPHHSEFGIGKYKKNCNFRKPNPGMINKAIVEMNINKNKSFMIGDKLTDLQAAKRAKIKFYYKKDFSLLKQIQKYIN